MSKLNSTLQLPSEFNRQALARIFSAIDQQANGLAEGRIAATYNAGTAAPTTGSYQRGDRIWNSEPSAGGYIGWVCVTAGTPGTWKGFGTIQA